MFDFIKRSQLRRQGLSCGKTRRKHLQGEKWEILRLHPLVGVVAFAVCFVAAAALLSAIAAGLDHQSAGFNMVFVLAIFGTASLNWYLGFTAGTRSNSIILLTFSAILIQLSVIGLMLHYGQSRGWSPAFSIFV